MISVYVEGVGILGPGLTGWPQARVILSGLAPYAAADLPRLSPALLAPDIRRRTGDHIRLAVQVAAEAVEHSGRAAADLASVFATSESDGHVTHAICDAVVQEQPAVSPTKFHNSVTNAPAGYWSMAANSLQPSTSVCGFDASFAVGLLEACAQILIEQREVLLIAHDTQFPEPLHSVRPMSASFGAALVLAQRRSPHSLAKFTVSVLSEAPAETSVPDRQLEALRRGNPAARCLPLLAAVARAPANAVVLPYIGGQGLHIVSEPC